MKKLWIHLGENRPLFLCTLLAGLAYSLNSVVLPTASGDLVSRVTAASSLSPRLFLPFLTLSLFQLALAALDQYMTQRLTRRQKQLLRKRAFDGFSQSERYSREDAAAFASFVNNDVPSLAEQYFTGAVDIVKCVSLLLFSAAALLTIHWLLAAVITGISVLTVVIPGVLRKKSGNARQAYSRQLARYNASLQSLLGGLHILKTYCCREHAAAQLDAENCSASAAEAGLYRWHLTTYGAASFLQITKNILVLSVGILLIHCGAMPVGGLVAVLQLASVIGAPVEVLAYLLNSRNAALPLLAHLEELTPERVPEEGRICREPFVSLSAEGVSCRAGELQILQNVSTVFQAGKNYLLTGGSGSGKSTFLRLLARMGGADCTGTVLLNRTDARAIALASYYKLVCPVFQEPYLFRASLRENILLGREVSEEDYRDVIGKLHLAYLLDRCGGQELTPEMIEQLSGGERQRVALARAMVGKPAIYLLDEVTSALDRENTERVERLLLQEDAAVVHVCHKPNPALAPLYDGRFVMVDGVLREV